MTTFVLVLEANEVLIRDLAKVGAGTEVVSDLVVNKLLADPPQACAASPVRSHPLGE